MEGERVLTEAVKAYQLAFGDRLLAAYALGSLAHGGFSELVSDIDLGLIVDDPLREDDDETIRRVASEEQENGSAVAERLSVFWGTPASLRGEREGGRFPALDRLDLIESGRLLAGTDDARMTLPRPDGRELTVTGAEFALDHLAEAVEEIRCPTLLVGRGVRRVTKVVLFPVRFLFTAATGQVGTNDAATTWYLGDSRAPSRPLVAAALEWRTSPPTDDAATALLRRQIGPLYLHYIADHVTRLESFGEAVLAEGFREWRDRLTAEGS